MNLNGAPGLRSGPSRSTRHIFVSVFSTEYASLFPCREMAGACAFSEARGSLRGLAEADAPTRQRPSPEENTISLPSDVHAVPMLDAFSDETFSGSLWGV